MSKKYVGRIVRPVDSYQYKVYTGVVMPYSVPVTIEQEGGSNETVIGIYDPETLTVTVTTPTFVKNPQVLHIYFE